MFYVPQILRLAQKQGTSLSQDNLSLKLFIVQFIPLFQDEWCMCRAYLFLKSWTASPKWAKLASQNRSFLKCFGITDYGNDFEKKKPGIIAQGITWTGTISLVSFLNLFFFFKIFFYTIYAAIICLLKGTKSYRIFEDLVSFYHVIVWSDRPVENSPERDCCW